MTIGRLLTQPLTVYPVTRTTDAYNNQVVGRGDGIAVKGLLQQVTSTEFVNDRDTSVTQWTAFLPASTQLGPLCQIGYGDQIFQVNGEPERVWNPRTARVSHIEAKLTEVS